MIELLHERYLKMVSKLHLHAGQNRISIDLLSHALHCVEDIICSMQQLFSVEAQYFN